MATIQIKPVSTGHRQAWETLFRSYAGFYHTGLTDSGTETVWNWIHNPAEAFHAVIAWRGDEALGLAQYQLMHRSLAGGMTCYLSDLFTTPAARGAGIGRQLIDYIRDWTAGQGVTNLRWLTAEDNATARKLYDSYAPRSPFILYSIPTTAG